MKKINDIIQDMFSIDKARDLKDAREMVNMWLYQLIVANQENEHYIWRQDLCNRLGFGCEAGTRWTVDEMYNQIQDFESSARVLGALSTI